VEGEGRRGEEIPRIYSPIVISRETEKSRSENLEKRVHTTSNESGKNCIYSVERKKKREMDKNKEGEREKDGRSEATLKTLLRIAARHERIGGERESACWRRSGSTVTGGRRLGTTQRAKRGWWSEEKEEEE